MIRERVRVRALEIAAIIEISILGEFISTDQGNYFTFSNNSDIIPPREAIPNSIFIFDDVALRQAGRDKKILCNGTTRGCRLLLSLSDVRKNIEAPYM